MKRSIAFEEADLSPMMLPADEPLSIEVIQAHQVLARHVIKQALTDITSENELDKRSAIRFCLADDPETNQVRAFWLGWINMHEDVLARTAQLRLQWNEANKTVDGLASARRSRVLPKGEALPLRRSRPLQPEGLSYRA